MCGHARRLAASLVGCVGELESPGKVRDPVRSARGSCFQVSAGNARAQVFDVGHQRRSGRPGLAAAAGASKSHRRARAVLRTGDEVDAHAGHHGSRRADDR